MSLVCSSCRYVVVCNDSSTAAVHHQGRHLPFRGAEAISNGLTVQADHRDSLIAVFSGRCPCCVVVHIPYRGAEADSHGPHCSSDRRYIPVPCGQGGRFPLFAGGASSTGAVVERTVVLPQLHAPAQ